MQIGEQIRTFLANFVMQIIKEHEIDFIRLIESQITDAKILHIVQTNPSCWGDSSKLHIADTASVVNTQFNTSSGDIYIGEYAFTGHHVSIITGTHDYSKKLIDRQLAVPQEGNDIWIGCGAWLGSHSVILGPNKIGDNAVIAAGAVVLPNTNVPANTIFGGVPAKYIKDIGS